MKFNECLLKYRKDKNLTQDDLAEKLNVSRQSISKWENGECTPDVSKLIVLSEVLEITIDELCGKEVINDQSEGKTLTKDNEPGRKKLVILIAVFIITAVIVGVGGYLIGNHTGSQNSSGSYLPDNITVSSMQFSYQNQQLKCSFVPSFKTDNVVYTVSLIDEFNNKMSVEAEYKNGICTAYFDVNTQNFSRLVLTVSNDQEDRNITMAKDLSVDENGYSFSNE